MVARPVCVADWADGLFDSFPTGVLGRLARISISVGISYLASLSARKDFSSSIPNAACPGFSAIKVRVELDVQHHLLAIGDRKQHDEGQPEDVK